MRKSVLLFLVTAFWTTSLFAQTPRKTTLALMDITTKQDSIATEVSKTKLKMPALTYCTLGGTALLAGITYVFYRGTQSSYDKYLAAKTADEATKYWDETESKNRTAIICSYSAIGVGTVNLVSWFLRVKANPGLMHSSLNLSPYLFLMSGNEGAVGVDLSWRF